MKVEFQSQIDAAKFLHVVAADCVNQMTNLDQFWDGIPDSEKFDFANRSTHDIKIMVRKWLGKNRITMAFYSGWLFRGVVAHVKPKRPRTIYFNTRHYDFCQLKGETLKQDILDKIETISHELVHVVDSLYEDASFGHGSGSDPVEHANTFPYWFGRYCADFFERHGRAGKNHGFLEILKKD